MENMISADEWRAKRSEEKASTEAKENANQIAVVQEWLKTGESMFKYKNGWRLSEDVLSTLRSKGFNIEESKIYELDDYGHEYVYTFS